MSSHEAGDNIVSLPRNGEFARAKSSPPLALLRLTAWAAWTAACFVPYMFRRVLVIGKPAKRRIAVRWSRRWFIGCLALAGIRTKVHGEVPDSPVLLTPNHLGYLDILAIGAACGTLFVSKAEVTSWPIIGFLFRCTEGIAVSRARLRGVREANGQVVECLSQGTTVCVFLEGTSSGGGEVMPFHASLLQPAIDADVNIVPTAIQWFSKDPRIDIAEDVAYWKDHTLVPHFWRVLGLRGLSVEVSFGKPVPAAGADRKSLAKTAHGRVAKLLEERLGSH